MFFENLNSVNKEYFQGKKKPFKVFSKIYYYLDKKVLEFKIKLEF